jgi:hypothetical protein
MTSSAQLSQGDLTPPAFPQRNVRGYLLRSHGRLWWCSCDYLLLWLSELQGAPDSQHLLDPSSFTRLLHGFVPCGLLGWLSPRVSAVWQLWLSVSIEALWEVVENSDFEQRWSAAPTW